MCRSEMIRIFLMLFGPLLASFLPGELTALFPFQPFIFPDLFFNQIGNPNRTDQTSSSAVLERTVRFQGFDA